MDDRLSDEQRRQMLQFMATEHSVLQAGRSATIFETGSRITGDVVVVASRRQPGRLNTDLLWAVEDDVETQGMSSKNITSCSLKKTTGSTEGLQPLA